MQPRFVANHSMFHSIRIRCCIKWHSVKKRTNNSSIKPGARWNSESKHLFVCNCFWWLNESMNTSVVEFIIVLCSTETVFDVRLGLCVNEHLIFIETLMIKLSWLAAVYAMATRVDGFSVASLRSSHSSRKSLLSEHQFPINFRRHFTKMMNLLLTRSFPFASIISLAQINSIAREPNCSVSSFCHVNKHEAEVVSLKEVHIYCREQQQKAYMETNEWNKIVDTCVQCAWIELKEKEEEKKNQKIACSLHTSKLYL